MHAPDLARRRLLLASMALWLLNSVESSVRGRATGFFRTLIYISGFVGPQLARLSSDALGSSQGTLLGYALLALSLAVLLSIIEAAKGNDQAAAETTKVPRLGPTE